MEQLSTEFTPGPWQSKHDYSVEGVATIIANVDGESFSDGTETYTYDTIAICEDEYGERLPNAQANARLIRAAPDLYRTLSIAVDIIAASGGLWLGEERARALLASVRDPRISVGEGIGELISAEEGKARLNAYASQKAEKSA